MTARKSKVHGRRRKGEAISRLHLRVVDEYMKDFSKSAALERAGYENPVASRRIFDRPEVEAEIQRRQAKLSKKLNIDAESVLQEIAKIAFGTVGKFIRVNADGLPFWDFSGATEDDLALIGELTTDEYAEGRGEGAALVKKFKIKPLDKQKALEMLARHLGLFDDKVTVQGELSIVERLNKGRERLRQPEPSNG